MADTLSGEEIRQRVITILRRDLKLGPDAQIDDNKPFFSADSDLDSLDMLLLVSSVEKEFKIKIANEQVGQEAFQNVATLAKFIAEQLPKFATAPAKPINPLDRLPHREPFRFISKLVDLKPGESAEAAWVLTGNEPFFAGHFPGRPLVPGVLIAEALAQLSGLVGATDGSPDQGMLAHFDVRFDRAIAPPASITLKSHLLRQMGQLQQFEVSAEAEGQVIARGTLALHRPANDTGVKA